jgi:hypothetical protein
MKQLYYTSCRLGHSLNGQSGFQVRAATPGLDNAHVRAAVAYVGYKPPDSLPPTEDAVAGAPVRLALLQTPDLGRILLHSVYVGREGQGTRFGNFFSHLLLDVPPGLTAREAVRLWQSPFWQRRDADDFGKNLPDANSPLPPGDAPDFDLRRLLADKRPQDMLRFLLDALLLPQHRGRRIFLAAPAREVACYLYAVTSILPLQMTVELTFSTYEYAPLASRARVVGADAGTDAGTDLPEACYSDSCLGFHRVSGRKSDLGGSTPFAEYAVRMLAKGRLPELVSFADWCGKRQVSDGGLLELAFRITRSQEAQSEEETRIALGHVPLGKELLKKPAVIGKLSMQNCLLALGDAELAEELFRNPRALEKIVGWALEDAAFHEEALPLVVSYLDAKDDDRPVLNREGVSELTRRRLGDWLFLHRFEENVSLVESDLVRAGKVLSRAPEGARERRLAAVAGEAAEAFLNQPIKDPQRTLEAVVRGLARNTPGAVYARVCEYATERAHSLVRPDVLLALIAVGFGLCHAPDLAEALGADAAQRAEALLHALKQEKKQTLLLVVRNAVRGWPRHIREHVRRLIPLPFWRRLRRALRWWPVRTALVLAVFGGLALLAVRQWPGQTPLVLAVCGVLSLLFLWLLRRR